MSGLTRVARFFSIAALLVFSLVAVAQDSSKGQQDKLNVQWQAGPSVGNLGGIAQIQIPEGYLFTDKAGAQELLRYTHNFPSGRELGALVEEGKDWFMTFEFEDRGYVKDDEKNLDAGALLKNLQDGTEAGNADRRQRGWSALHIAGWRTSPYYDPLTHNLTWAVTVTSDNANSSGSVNHSIRLLGRKGTVDVDLVVAPNDYAASLPEFNSLVSGFSYTEGNRYADFKSGDKVAEYGLAALIAGGAGAVALKTGLLAKLWKFIVVGIAAIGAAIKRFFKAIFGGNESKVEDPSKNAAAQG